MRPDVPKLDAQLGMLAYSTDFGGIGGRVKERLSDFVVSEVLSSRPPAGDLPTYVVQKANRNTIDVAEELERAIRCRVKFWGLKDRRSISTQFMQCTVPRSRPTQAASGRGWSARLVGMWRELSSEHFAGNAFSIRIRGSGIPAERLAEAAEALRSGAMANFFGYQRFGAANQNHLLGRCIVRRDRGECRGLVEGMPRRVRRLAISAYQSYLFNLSISRVLMEEGGLPRRAAVVHRVVPRPFLRAMEEPMAAPAHLDSTVPSAPVPGYSYRSRGDAYSRALDEVMREEGVSPRDFYMDDAPNLSAEGGWRPAALLGEARAGRDGELKLLLQRGSYATVFLRELMKPEDPVGSGLARRRRQLTSAYPRSLRESRSPSAYPASASASSRFPSERNLSASMR